MSSKYSFSVLKSTWGILINIDAEYTSKTQSTYKHVKSICPGLWGILLEDFPNEENFLWEGLKRVSESILSKTPYKSDTLIVIRTLEFNYCDFQNEGLTAGIMKWAAQVFDFEEPKIQITFNKELNKYEFVYD